MPRLRPGSAASGQADTPNAALGLVPPAWQLHEGPPRGPPGGASSILVGAGAPPTSAVVTSAIDRLLMGFGPEGAEARIRIGQGPLAGTEIHLRQHPGGIDALVLTRVESSRQTLAVAMEEVARRLQRKGYVFRAAPAEPGEARPLDQGQVAAGLGETGGGPAWVVARGEHGASDMVDRR